MSLEIKKLNKSYGTKKVVDNISFSLKKPGIIGLLGTNGAGKTTTIRMILNILNKDSGEIYWNNETFDVKKTNFGYLPEERGLYQKIPIKKQLLYFATLKKLNKEKTEKEIDYWIKRLKLEEYQNLLPNQLSKGNSQKVQLIISLIGDPELLILDEPFSGLDPVNTELLKDVINELVKKNKYIIFCSHQMSMVESFCEEVIIINKGKVVLNGNLKEIKNSYPENKIFVETKSDLSEILKDIKFIQNNNEYIITLDKTNKKELLDTLVSKNVDIEKFYVMRPSLQEIFIESVGK